VTLMTASYDGSLFALLIVTAFLLWKRARAYS